MKAYAIIELPDDAFDVHERWAILNEGGSIRYLDDNAWVHFEDVDELELRPLPEMITDEHLKINLKKICDECPAENIACCSRLIRTIPEEFIIKFGNKLYEEAKKLKGKEREERERQIDIISELLNEWEYHISDEETGETE